MQAGKNNKKKVHRTSFLSEIHETDSTRKGHKEKNNVPKKAEKTSLSFLPFQRKPRNIFKSLNIITAVRECIRTGVK